MKKTLWLCVLLLGGLLASAVASADDWSEDHICYILCKMQLGGYACNCSIPSLP